MSCNFFTEPVDVVISHVLEYVPRRGAYMSHTNLYAAPTHEN